jgi:two-component system, chemotaxis family, CheB/CheR fusion protein
LKKLNKEIAVKDKTSDMNSGVFPIVGIGASAGGLEALEQFLKNVPEKSGMAYVVIQHLDPTQKGMLPELLQRISRLQVFQVEDLMNVKPDCVYVIPPNKSMSIFKGVLHLFEPVESRGLRLPVDFFLHSLADDQKESAVGVILSGMGSDGSSGTRAIKEKNGFVLVQEPETARFDSMPRNAINSAQVDIVAPPEILPIKLIELLTRVPAEKPKIDDEEIEKSSFEKIIILLRVHTGNDFSLYKKNSVLRRIERRMGIHKIEEIQSYVRFLQENPKEVHILFKELMIGVTNFFRDADVWEKLKESVIPSLIDKLQPKSRIRAWVTGCSTGEEAYSLAIIIKEVLEKIDPKGITLQIFASDIDSDAIEIARKGVFSENIAADVTEKRLNRFFLKTDEGYRISTEIREMVIFAQHNLIMHPPFTNIDILSCRNLLIYVNPELQRKLLGLFYYSLNPEGILILGTSETLGEQSHLFSPLLPGLKIYKRSVANLNSKIFDFPSSFTRSHVKQIENTEPARPVTNIQTLADQLLLQQFSPSGVLVNENGDILYISGRTGKYLEPAVGKANLNIFAMLRPGFKNDFAIAFRKVTMNKDAVILPRVKIGTDGGSLYVNVKIQWIHKPEPLYGKLMVIFTDVPSGKEIKTTKKTGHTEGSGKREAELEEELKHSREEMQSILEEMQTFQEELKSTNEELQSTNEELQSANEELTSSKEEMQSLNEELQTVNAELMAKVEDYSRVNNDMKNLLNSTDIATLFLDKDLNIRSYTNQATKIFKLIKSDIGRPFTDQASLLVYPELPEDAQEVLKTLIFIEKQIPTKEGKWLSIRVMPYRTFDDRIDGLVITFIDISELKMVEEKWQKVLMEIRLLSSLSSNTFIKLTSDWKILEFNSAAEKFFGKKKEDVTGKNFFEFFIPETLRNKTEQQLNNLVKSTGYKTIKMKVSEASGNEPEIEWVVGAHHSHEQLPAEVIIIQNK